MRVLVVNPGVHFSVADVHKKLIKGLVLQGCLVCDAPFDSYLDFFSAAHIDKGGGLVQAVDGDTACHMAGAMLDSSCYRFEPDVIIVVSSFFVPPDKYKLWRERGHKIVLYCTESPYEDERQAWMAGLADLVIVNDPINLDMYRAVNKNTHYVPHCYDPDIHHPGEHEPDNASDFFFLGTGYPSRIDFLEHVDWTGLDVKLGGNWREAKGTILEPFVVHDLAHCIDNDEAQGFYWSTKLSANLYRKEAMSDDLVQGWALSPREVELAATETFFLRESRGESDELFPMLPTFDSPGDFSEKLRWWLTHDDARNEAARSARAAIEDRTVTKTAQTVLRLINQ